MPPSPDPPYCLVRSRRREKTLSMQVLSDGRILVQAPWRTGRREIDAFVERKRGWLSRKLREREEAYDRRPVRAYLPGERFPYLGGHYPLRLREGDSPSPLAFSEGSFWIREQDVSRAAELFSAWYREQARTFIAQRVAWFGDRTGLRPADVRIGNARRRWGSCSSRNRVSFTWRLILVPPPMLDYVVVHELVHLKEKHHADSFWKAVAEILPDHEDRRRRLRRHTHEWEL